MNKKNLILLYGRSNLNIVISLGTVALIVGSILIFNGILRILLPLVIFSLYILVSVMILLGKKGAKEILEEEEEDRLNKVEGVITRYRDMRDRIAFLRFGNEEVNKALEYFLLISGTYLNKCREIALYSPEANRKIEEVLEVCQIYLEEYDERLTEKRYGVKDKDHFTEYTARTVQAIRSAGDRIKERLETDLVGLTQKEKMEIIEEMNNE
jgi:hypothetical protein